MLRFLDAGESHGKGMVTIVEGIPLGVALNASSIEAELARRRLGYGRSARMSLEADRVEIWSGVRYGSTLGSPIAMLVANRESGEFMRVEREGVVEPLTAPRPGHADLPGALKYGTGDIRDILERASARETVGRVCAGAVAKRLLLEMDIRVLSHVTAVGGITREGGLRAPGLEEIAAADEDPMRCLDAEASLRMRKEIDRAREEGDSLGGTFEVVAYGLPAGLGSHVHWDRRLDARLAAAVMSIQAIKGVEIGSGFRLASMRGSQAMDTIHHGPGRGYFRGSNHAGGLEGGMTNSEPLVIRAAMKPIPTLASGLESVDLISKEKVEGVVERADTCAVPAAGVIAEAMVAFVVADALLEKTGGDSLREVKGRYKEILAAQERC
ncbi:MAG: chorismate synthase [Actinobacteria bacterium]|jgi:chorismate synthase|nr:MAG: chorismate synthase [Actinomycetota bacterium]